MVDFRLTLKVSMVFTCLFISLRSFQSIMVEGKQELWYLVVLIWGDCNVHSSSEVIVGFFPGIGMDKLP